MNYLSKHRAVSPAVQDGGTDMGSVEHEGDVNRGAESGPGAPIVRVGVYSLIVNVVLVAGKLTLAFVTGSLALRADAVHSLVDVFASIALILGLVISGRKSRDFPLSGEKSAVLSPIDSALPWNKMPPGTRM